MIGIADPVPLEIFQGTVLRSFTWRRARGREFFQWFDAGDKRAESGPLVGDEAVDSGAFDGARKLGPALIYCKEVEVKGDLLSEYFAGNEAVELDKKSRASIAAHTDFKWPSDEEYVRGFHEKYSAEFIARNFPPDPVWGGAAEHGVGWFTARAIAKSDTGNVEVLCWLSVEPGDHDDVLLQRVEDYLRGRGLEVIGGLIELFDTHHLRPQSGMILFEIARKTRLDRSEYVERFVRELPSIHSVL
jgi:hypothetical protein